MPNYARDEARILDAADLALTTRARQPELGALSDPDLAGLLRQLAARADAHAGGEGASLFRAALRRANDERRRRAGAVRANEPAPEKAGRGRAAGAEDGTAPVRSRDAGTAAVRRSGEAAGTAAPKPPGRRGRKAEVAADAVRPPAAAAPAVTKPGTRARRAAAPVPTSGARRRAASAAPPAAAKAASGRRSAATTSRRAADPRGGTPAAAAPVAGRVRPVAAEPPETPQVRDAADSPAPEKAKVGKAKKKGKAKDAKAKAKDAKAKDAKVKGKAKEAKGKNAKGKGKGRDAKAGGEKAKSRRK